MLKFALVAALLFVLCVAQMKTQYHHEPLSVEITLEMDYLHLLRPFPTDTPCHERGQCDIDLYVCLECSNTIYDPKDSDHCIKPYAVDFTPDDFNEANYMTTGRSVLEELFHGHDKKNISVCPKGEYHLHVNSLIREKNTERRYYYNNTEFFHNIEVYKNVSIQYSARNHFLYNWPDRVHPWWSFGLSIGFQCARNYFGENCHRNCIEDPPDQKYICDPNGYKQCSWLTKYYPDDAHLIECFGNPPSGKSCDKPCKPGKNQYCSNCGDLLCIEGYHFANDSKSCIANNECVFACVRGQCVINKYSQPYCDCPDGYAGHLCDIEKATENSSTTTFINPSQSTHASSPTIPATASNQSTSPSTSDQGHPTTPKTPSTPQPTPSSQPTAPSAKPQPQKSTSSSGKGMSGGAIVGIVIVTLVLVVAIAFFGQRYYRNRNNQTFRAGRLDQGVVGGSSLSVENPTYTPEDNI